MSAATNDLPCAECGAPLSFKPGAGKLACPFCGTENEIEGANQQISPWGARTGSGPEIRELDYHAALRDALDDADIEETATVRCPGCAAEVSLDANTLADQCPFCATPMARGESHSHRHPKPQGVLPFAFEERDARGHMAKWLGSLWFAPNSLKKYAEAGRPLAGIYLPHYTYDAIGDAEYRGQRGDAYYVTRTRTVMVDGKPTRQTYQERKIRWSNVSGRVRHMFDDVLVQASETMGATKGGAEYAGTSWDLAALEPYRTEYLAGFRAEAPAVSLEDGYARANQIMDQMLIRDIKFDIGGDAQRISQMDARYSSITFKHVLLPVWLASYRWKNKPFRVVVNGRTGQVQGERPYSVWKIALAVVCGLIVAGAIGYLVATNQ
ncbi:MAG: primosomal protein N' (replication factor Y) - superfamily II helicase [Paracoccaceae bacterium]